MIRAMRIRDARSALKRGREQRRRLLTRGERAFAWSLSVASSLLVLGGIALLVWGAGRGVGVALLIVALLVVAVPISPSLKARVRRREARAARQR